jgi:hypothetical protein
VFPVLIAPSEWKENNDHDEDCGHDDTAACSCVVKGFKSQVAEQCPNRRGWNEGPSLFPADNEIFFHATNKSRIVQLVPVKPARHANLGQHQNAGNGPG